MEEETKEGVENCLYMFGSMVLSHGVPIRDEDVKMCLDAIENALAEAKDDMS